MLLVSSLAVREIVDEGFGPRDTSHGGGFVAWGRAALAEKKKTGRQKMRWKKEE